MSPTNCPWCGAPPRTVRDEFDVPLRKGRVEWCCGSFKHGPRLWQDQNCELNVAEAEIERLQKVLTEICDELYGQGFDVLGWHLNGASEPLDSWFDDNGWCKAAEAEGGES